MKIERQQVGTVEVVTPVGPLVDDDSAMFCNDLLQRLKGANPRLVLALQDVPYLDSAAIEGMLDAADELGKRAQQLKLASVSPTVREVFELTGVVGRFQLFADVQNAVRSFL